MAPKQNLCTGRADASLGQTGIERGPFRGIALRDFIYPGWDTSTSPTEVYCLPFEDSCAPGDWIGFEIVKRRVVVPSVLLALPDCPRRDRLIQAIAALYVVAVCDFAHAEFRQLRTKRGTDFNEGALRYRQEIVRLNRRFDDAVCLLRYEILPQFRKREGVGSVQTLAEKTAQALIDHYERLVRPARVGDFAKSSPGGSLAIDIRTEFTATQWLDCLHQACEAATGGVKTFPPLPKLQGDPQRGYVLTLDAGPLPEPVDCCAEKPWPALTALAAGE